MITYTFNLDVVPGGVPVIVPLTQYEDDFMLQFRMFSSQGDLSLPSGTNVAIRGMKPDGNGYSANTSFDPTPVDFDDGTVTVEGDVQMTAAAGKSWYELVFKKDSKTLCTARFVLVVERAAMDQDTFPSESVIKELFGVPAGLITDMQEILRAASYSSSDMSALIAGLSQYAGQSGGSGGTGDHSQLTNRNALNQHPMVAITGLQDALQGLEAAKLSPTSKTSAMTQPVGKDGNGKLWTEPSGGDTAASSTFIDLVKYGIVEGDITHKSPFSSSEWEQAHNNQEGIRNALVEMAASGITNISLPKGTYVICYQNPTGAAWHSNTGWEIVIPSNVTFDLNGSTIKVIYDSANRNPYDLSNNQIYALNGNAFVFSKSYDAHLINGVILGDRYERNFTISAEKNEEQTYGVYVKEGSARCSVENLSISGFMGDAVSGNASHNPDLGSSVSNPKTFTNGEIGANGAESQSAKPTTFVSDYIDISGVIQNTNQIVLRTNLGYQYRLQSDYEFRMFFYDTGKTFISYADYYQCDNIPVPHGTVYVRIMLVNESLSGQTSADITYQISPLSSEFFTAYNCKFYNNNRGGMSNLPHDCTVDSCELYENGTAGTEGFPVFGDTTRYAINCEDTVSRKLSVINCNIHNGFNLFLLNVRNLYIANNAIYDFAPGGVSITWSEKAVVDGNFFRNTGGVHASKAVTDVIVTNNHFENCSLNQESSLGKLHYIDNLYESNKVDIALPKSSVSKFLSVRERLKSVDEYFVSKIGGTFVDTTFDFINEQYSTANIIVDMGETSDGNVINMPSGRELFPTNVVGTKINGGFIRNRGGNVNWRLKDSQINLLQAVDLSSYQANNEHHIALYGCKININDDFSGNKVFVDGNNAANTGNYNTNYVFDSCTIEVDNDSVAAFIRSSPGIKGGTTIIHNSYEFRNCVFVNKGSTAVSIINFAGDYVPDTSNYSLTFVDNEIVGLWNLPPVLDSSIVRFLNKYNPVEKTSAMTQPVGVDGDGKLFTAPGGGGSDVGLNITNASVGQIAKITAVDGTGKPTAWEPVDMAGGSGSLELINHVVTDEDVMSIMVDKDSNGRAFELNKFVIFVKLMPNSTEKTGWIRLFPNTYNSPMAIGSGSGITEGSWRAVFTGSINGGIFIPGVSVCTMNAKSTPYGLTNNISGMNQGGGEFVFPYEVDKFTSFQWTSYQPSIGAGSEIWVYGVRV